MYKPPNAFIYLMPQKAQVRGLAHYMAKNKATNQTLAEKSGVHISTVARARKGEPILLHLAEAILEALEKNHFEYKRKPPFNGGHPAPIVDGWEAVVHAMDLPPCLCCSEPWCPTHKMHYSDCDCVGPNQEHEYEYKTEEDIMYARKL